MRYQKFLLFLAILFLFSCQPADQTASFDIQGHRGCRGYYPENSLIGFQKAIEMGVNTLEMDVVITQDKQVLVSHEPWMSNLICLDSFGNTIADSLATYWNIYQMDYDEVAQFQCGSFTHPNFPEQQQFPYSKPLLKTVVAMAEDLVAKEGLQPIQYNIEIKSALEGDEIFHPKPEEFVDLVLSEIKKAKIEDRTIIQSFDPRVLMVINDHYPHIKTAYLTDNQLGFQHNLSRLDFKPTIFSPHKMFVTQAMIDYFHKENIQVIPWTVNDTSTMKTLIDLGVDGIITDYPDRLVDLVNRHQ